MNPNAPCRALLLGGMPAVTACARCGAATDEPCRQKIGLAMPKKDGLARPSKTK